LLIAGERPPPTKKKGKREGIRRQKKRRKGKIAQIVHRKYLKNHQRKESYETPGKNQRSKKEELKRRGWGTDV